MTVSQMPIVAPEVLNVTDDDVAAVVHLLRCKPVQDRSREKVRRMLQATAELAADGTYVRMETIRLRAGLKLTGAYRYFDDSNTVAGCLALIWERRMIAAIANSTITGAANNARTLAGLLIDQHVAYYQAVSFPRPEASDPLPERHERMAAAFQELHADAPEGDWGVYCRTAVESADTAARVKLFKGPGPGVAEEMANLLAWYLDDRDLVVPRPTPRPPLPIRDRTAFRPAPDLRHPPTTDPA